MSTSEDPSMSSTEAPPEESADPGVEAQDPVAETADLIAESTPATESLHETPEDSVLTSEPIVASEVHDPVAESNDPEPEVNNSPKDDDTMESGNQATELEDNLDTMETDDPVCSVSDGPVEAETELEDETDPIPIETTADVGTEQEPSVEAAVASELEAENSLAAESYEGDENSEHDPVLGEGSESEPAPNEESMDVEKQSNDDRSEKEKPTDSDDVETSEEVVNKSSEDKMSQETSTTTTADEPTDAFDTLCESSATDQPEDATKEAECSTDDSGIKIVAVGQDGENGLKIASVSSVDNEDHVVSNEDDDTVQVLDEDKSIGETNAKKPMLKLASFADLGSNGISDGTPMTTLDLGNCGQCSNKVDNPMNALIWEAMIFCNVTCLADYQLKLCLCATCNSSVAKTSLGKYCVRFGSNIKQFCSNVCLEDHKKGLKVCVYCQKDISGGEGFLAPIGDKGQFKDFCVKECLQKYEELNCGKVIEKETTACAVCSQEKPVEVSLLSTEDEIHKLCSAPCFSSYKFCNNIESGPCDLCSKEMDLKKFPFKVIHVKGMTKRFCSQTCYNVFIFQSREIVLCLWCKVKKYNFDMIERVTTNASSYFCSVNCFNFHHNKPVPILPAPPSIAPQWNGVQTGSQPTSLPIIQSVSSLAGTGDIPTIADRLPTEPIPHSHMQQPVQTITQTIKEKETIVKYPEAVEMKNKSTMAKPFMHTKGVSCRPHPCHKGTQTDIPSLPVLAPVGVPMYMPVPTVMYQKPYPVPVPIPIPIPVPVFIPTSRNTARGVMKQIKKIRAKLPTDPFEAELLAMAGALVNKDEDSDDSVEDPSAWDDDYDNGVLGGMHLPHPPDLECDIKADRVIPKPLPQVTPDMDQGPQPFGYNRQHTPVAPTAPVIPNIPGRTQQMQQMRGGQGIKRRYSSREDEEEEDENSPWRRQQPDWRSKAAARGRNNRKQSRTEMISRETTAILTAFNKPPDERPDVKNHLKFTYGVNAWKHWVVGKNAELEKARAQGRYIKPFETDILKLRADELNYTLCLFVKEVKKPNGDAYAPDSILYLTLGIQEYLFENGRIDNIFMDNYYEPFTSALHEVIKDFRLPVNELGYYVTRIEEEHLWESKQLGAHSPQVLLNTLVYFNTKYFMLKVMDDHIKLAFTHILKHWKKGNGMNASATKTLSNSPGSQGRTVLLRYYPPPSKLGNRHDDRKCYEQHENGDAPLRCPVKLYEFYLSKCPESMKSRSDIFYLLPERSCVPDSPVWYSTSPLPSLQLDKMLQRIMITREVQEHMLADAS